MLRACDVTEISRDQGRREALDAPKSLLTLPTGLFAGFRLTLGLVLELQGSSLVLGVGFSTVRTADVYLITCDEVL